MTKWHFPSLIQRPAKSTEQQDERDTTRADIDYLKRRQNQIAARLEALRIDVEVRAARHLREEHHDVGR